jgi:SAM-dependent methyltransferase
MTATISASESLSNSPQGAPQIPVPCTCVSSRIEEQAERLHTSAATAALRLRCPQCFSSMGALDPLDGSAPHVCSNCQFVLINTKGIWRALPAERAEYFQQFVRDYQMVRALEGRGSASSDYYLGLPYADLTGRNQWQWRIRARSYTFLEKKVLPHLAGQCPGGMRVLDIGAGNCWMSYRLALKGQAIAVDLLDNDQDGLGAATHYFPFLPKPFPRFQAEMDRLPFDEAQFDIAIFNASFHYSEDYQRTLREALRCLRRPGHVIILDSPLYRRDESGRQMVEERQAFFEKRFGFPSNSIPSREYLTAEVLDELARTYGLSWKILKPWYGLAWALRPLKARLLRRREPSKFCLLWGTVSKP